MLVFMGWEIIEIRQSDLCECMDIYIHVCSLFYGEFCTLFLFHTRM
jgi:hypothetical protein